MLDTDTVPSSAPIQAKPDRERLNQMSKQTIETFFAGKNLVVVAMPQAIAVLRDTLPGDWARAAGLELVLFGAVIVAVILLRPQGLARAP